MMFMFSLKVMCHNCNNVSKCCEQFWDLSLEFPDRYAWIFLISNTYAGRYWFTLTAFIFQVSSTAEIVKRTASCKETFNRFLSFNRFELSGSVCFFSGEYGNHSYS